MCNELGKINPLTGVRDLNSSKSTFLYRYTLPTKNAGTLGFVLLL